MQKTLLDTVYNVETPEAIDLSAQLAGPVSRILAYAIDLSIRILVLALVFAFLGLLGRAGLGLFLVVSFLMEWFYPVFFEVLRHGQTPGKKCLGLVVVNDDLTPVSLGASLTRNLLRAADFLPAGYLFGIVSMCLNQQFQRLGDIAAGSIVVYRSVARPELGLPDVAPEVPTLALSVEDQSAFMGFAQRHQQLSQSRKEELANILEPITHKKNADAVTYLQGIGCWILGGK